MENSINKSKSSIDNDEERVMHSESDNIEIMMNDEADEVINKLFDPLKNRFQNNLESMKASDFVFDYVYLLYYKCHKINPNRSGSYIDSVIRDSHTFDYSKFLDVEISSNIWGYLGRFGSKLSNF